jgi:hypothetical protein
MPEVPRVQTVLEAQPTANELVAALRDAGEKVTQQQGELLLAHMWFETRAGDAAYNWNAGNIATSDTKPDVPYYRPPWFELAPDASPTLRSLHAQMLKGQAPRAFRAYDDLTAGVNGYVLALKRMFPALLEASRTGDPDNFAYAIESSKYTPSLPAGVAQTLRNLMAKFRKADLFAGLPLYLKLPLSAAVSCCFCSYSG